MLEDLLNKRHPDITITSYSEISDGTPKQLKKEESITPLRINKLIHWTKQNVTPGDAKNIFPQVQGHSIEFSNDNSIIKPQSKLNLNGEFLNKYIEMEEKLKFLQQKHQDYSSLEVLRGKNLHIASQKIQSQLEVIQGKDKIIDELNIEIKKLQTTFNTQLKNKDSIIENQELQITNLTNKLKKEIEYRKQDENLLSEIKLNEIKRSSVYELNQKCHICQASKQELKNILQECSIDEEPHEQEVPSIIREVVTLLLTKQREQIDIAFQEYEEQLRSQSDQIDELKTQNTALLRDDSHIKSISPRPLRSVDFENMAHFKSIQTERSCNEITQIKQQYQIQIQSLMQKLQEQEKLLRQQDNLNSSRKKLNQLKEQNEIKTLQYQLKEKDKKNIDLFNQIKQLQKDTDTTIAELKEELEKQKKKLQVKNSEIKQFMEQNKSFQDKNNELNQKILELQQQLINDDFNKSPNKSIDQQRVMSQYLQPNLAQLFEGYKSYQQEFIDLKQVFTEKLKQYEILQTKIQQLQQENIQLCAHNQKLNLENQHIKVKKVSEEITTGARGSAATGDSINIRSFTEEDRKKQMNILDLIQPELMSTEETLYILKEILIRSVKSLELIKRIYQIGEIRELLLIIQQVDEKHQTSNSKKLTSIINSVLARKIKFQIS